MAPEKATNAPRIVPNIQYDIATPLGTLRLVYDTSWKAVIEMHYVEAPISPLPIPSMLMPLVQELNAFWQGHKRSLSFPIAIHKGTPFQRRVWEAVQQIPYGETRSYLDIAKAIGNPQAVRAVGKAISANPLLLRIPCHRVIGNDGSLGGFSAGLARKKALLELEQSMPNTKKTRSC